MKRLGIILGFWLLSAALLAADAGLIQDSENSSIAVPKTAVTPDFFTCGYTKLEQKNVKSHGLTFKMAFSTPSDYGKSEMSLEIWKGSEKLSWPEEKDGRISYVWSGMGSSSPSIAVVPLVNDDLIFIDEGGAAEGGGDCDFQANTRLIGVRIEAGVVKEFRNWRNKGLHFVAGPLCFIGTEVYDSRKDAVIKTYIPAITDFRWIEGRLTSGDLQNDWWRLDAPRDDLAAKPEWKHLLIQQALASIRSDSECNPRCGRYLRTFGLKIADQEGDDSGVAPVLNPGPQGSLAVYLDLTLQHRARVMGRVVWNDNPAFKGAHFLVESFELYRLTLNGDWDLILKDGNCKFENDASRMDAWIESFNKIEGKDGNGD